MQASSDLAGSTGLFGLLGRLQRAVAAALFVDPFALSVAAAGGWLTVMTLQSLGRLVVGGVGTHVGGVVSCSVDLAVLSAITILALAHILITGLAVGAQRKSREGTFGRRVGQVDHFLSSPGGAADVRTASLDTGVPHSGHTPLTIPLSEYPH